MIRLVCQKFPFHLIKDLVLNGLRRALEVDRKPAGNPNKDYMMSCKKFYGLSMTNWPDLDCTALCQPHYQLIR